MENSKTVPLNFKSLLLLPLLLFSCAKNDVQSYESYLKFASNLQLQQTEACTERCTELKKEFRYVVYVGEKIYCYWAEKQADYKVDFKKIADEFESQITTKTTEAEYFSLLVKWAGVFRDGHVNAMMKSDYSDLQFFTTDVRLEILAPGTDHEKLIVSRISPNVQILKVGTVVSKIQGKNWTEYIADAEKFTSGSTLQMRRRQVGNSIFGVLLEKEGARAIKIEGQFNGKDIGETIARNFNLYDGMDPDEPSETGLNLIKSAILENNIGYLRLDGFSGSQMKKLLDQAMDRLSDTSGIIIDLRKNGGGDLSGNAILSRLISAPINRFHQRARFSDMLNGLRPSNLIDYDYITGEFSEMKARKVLPAEEKNLYKRPILVLTSAFCFSACDTFVSAIKENKLGVVIGEATGGGTGNPQTIALPVSSHSFRYSVAQGFTAVSKVLLEGAGTQPDVVLEPTAEERAQGKDLQLLKAVQYFSNSLITSGQSTLVSLPQNLITAKTEAIKNPFEVERDREIRKSND